MMPIGHRASRSNQRHLHEGSLWSTQVIATEVAQFLPDTWLTRHRKGGSAAPEYSSGPEARNNQITSYHSFTHDWPF